MPPTHGTAKGTPPTHCKWCRCRLLVSQRKPDAWFCPCCDRDREKDGRASKCPNDRKVDLHRD